MGDFLLVLGISYSPPGGGETEFWGWGWCLVLLIVDFLVTFAVYVDFGVGVVSLCWNS